MRHAVRCVDISNTRGINHVHDILPVNETHGEQVAPPHRSVRSTTYSIHSVCTKVHIFTRIPPVVTNDDGKVIRDGLADRLPPYSRARVARNSATPFPNPVQTRLPSLLFLRRNSLGFPSFASWPPLVADYFAQPSAERSSFSYDRPLNSS